MAFFILVSGNAGLLLFGKMSEDREKCLQKGATQVPHGAVQTSICDCWGFRFL